MFEIGLNSGEMFFVKGSLGFFCVGGRRKVVTGTKEGVGCNIESHGS